MTEEDSTSGRLGIVYLAFGYRYVVMAINSALSARAAGTLCHIKLLTNLPIGKITIDNQSPFDEIVFLSEKTEFNRYTKIAIVDFAVEENNLYLDCDTVIRFPAHKLIPVVSRFDIAIKTYPVAMAADDEFDVGLSARDCGMSSFNAGVIFFRKSEGTRELFSLWQRFYGEGGRSRDQFSLFKAMMHAKSTRVLPLGACWNATPWPQLELALMRNFPDEVKILHYRDPVYWPSVGRDLAAIHDKVELTLTAASDELEKERLEYGKLTAEYKKTMFRYKIGRRLIEAKRALKALLEGTPISRTMRLRGKRELKS